MHKPKTVYVTYILTTPEKLWDALTRPEFTRKYFFGRAVELDCKVGGDFILRMEDGRIDVKGRVLASIRRAGSPSPGMSSGSRSSATCRRRSSPTTSSRSATRCG